MYSYTIVGYAVPNGSILCVECAEDTFTSDQLNGAPYDAREYIRWLNGCNLPTGTFETIAPIFAMSEFDYQPTCDSCRSKIDVVVLGDFNEVV